MIARIGPIAAAVFLTAAAATAQEDRPNILVIMGDDVGWYNNSPYSHGVIF